MYLKTRDRAETHRSSGNLFKNPKSPGAIVHTSTGLPAQHVHPTTRRTRMSRFVHPHS